MSDDPVRIKSAKAKTAHDGRTWYFCRGDCLRSFLTDPEKYMTYRCGGCGGAAPTSTPGTRSGVYEDRTIRFCCDTCQGQFERHQARYFSILVPEGGG